MTSVEDIPEWAEEQGLPQPSEPRPRIMVSGRYMRDISTEAIAALKQANGKKPWLFQRRDTLVRLRADKGLVAAVLTVA